jgi:hypothetical protein
MECFKGSILGKVLYQVVNNVNLCNFAWFHRYVDFPNSHMCCPRLKILDYRQKRTTIETAREGPSKLRSDM